MAKSKELPPKSAIAVINKTINILRGGGKCENCVWQDHYCAHTATLNSIQLSTIAKDIKINIEVVACDYFTPNSIDGKTYDEQPTSEKKWKTAREKA